MRRKKWAKTKPYNLPLNRPFLPYNETWRCDIRNFRIFLHFLEALYSIKLYCYHIHCYHIFIIILCCVKHTAFPASLQTEQTLHSMHCQEPSDLMRAVSSGEYLRHDGWPKNGYKNSNFIKMLDSLISTCTLYMYTLKTYNKNSFWFYDL
mgnify:CR=1 FL=1